MFWTKTDVIESNESSVASLISMKLDKQEDWYIRDESDDNQLIVKIVYVYNHIHIVRYHENRKDTIRPLKRYDHMM